MADRVDVGFARLMALTANMHRSSKSTQPAATMQDFLSSWWKEPEPEEPEDGMAPEVVMPVMQSFLERQQRRRH